MSFPHKRLRPTNMRGYSIQNTLIVIANKIYLTKYKNMYI